jgi:hypothetical protein
LGELPALAWRHRALYVGLRDQSSRDATIHCNVVVDAVVAMVAL